MRQTTRTLLDRLAAVKLGPYRVEVAEQAAESEVIYLIDDHVFGDYVLSVDEEDPLPTICLNHVIPYVGHELRQNLLVGIWVVDNESVLNEVVSAILALNEQWREGHELLQMEL